MKFIMFYESFLKKRRRETDTRVKSIVLGCTAWSASWEYWPGGELGKATQAFLTEWDHANAYVGQSVAAENKCTFL